jgi:hypothetical protein
VRNRRSDVSTSTQMMSETNDIENAARPVVEGHWIVDHQRRLVRLIASGHDVHMPQSTLDLFTRTLAIFENHLRQFRATRGYVGALALVRTTSSSNSIEKTKEEWSAKVSTACPPLGRSAAHRGQKVSARLKTRITYPGYRNYLHKPNLAINAPSVLGIAAKIGCVLVEESTAWRTLSSCIACSAPTHWQLDRPSSRQHPRECNHAGLHR